MGVELKINGARYAVVSDLHTHTRFSHGVGTIEANVRAAIALGLKQVGIADHGPGHIGFGVPRKRLAEMKAEIIRLRREHPEIEILFGVEANILVPDGRLDVKPNEYDYFDYICAGWHFGAVGGMTPAGIGSTLGNMARKTAKKAKSQQIRRNTDMIVGAILGGGMKFLTHPGVNAPVDMMEVAEAAAKTGTLLEINTSYMSITAEIIKKIMDTGVHFVINSDAHTPKRVGDFAEAAWLIEESGLDPARVVNLARI